MKKAQIIITILLIVVHIWMRFYAPIFNFALVLKHTSLFLVIGLIAYNIVTVIMKRLIKRYKPTGGKESVLYVGRTVIFGVIVLLVATLQFDYIQYSETPFVEHCRYYDKYNHLIYETMIYESCPELEVIASNRDVLVFNVAEYTDSYLVAELAPEQQSRSKWDTYNATLYSTIRIEYGTKSRIENISQQMTMVSENIDSDGNIDTYYYSYHKLISNAYNPKYEGVYKEAEILNHYEGIVEVYSSHHDFNEDDYITTTYYADNYVLDDSQSEGLGWQLQWEYELVKEHVVENEIVTESLAYINTVHENNSLNTTIERVERNDEGESHTVNLIYNEEILSRSLDNEQSNGDEILVDYTYQTERPHFVEYKKYSSANNSFFNEENIYEQYQVRNIMYLYIDSADSISIEHNPRIYGVVETEYGYQVTYERYRQKNYLVDRLYRGVSTPAYLTDSRYAYDLRYQILFDVEYSLVNLTNSDDIMYTHESYIMIDSQ